MCPRYGHSEDVFASLLYLFHLHFSHRRKKLSHEYKIQLIIIIILLISWRIGSINSQYDIA